ncbi:MAG: riboflavin synthase [Patescibacteria group bacterium]
MFTGITKGLCSVTDIEDKDNFSKITIDLDDLGADLKIGDSVSINGVCLTAIEVNNKAASFEVVGETLKKSNLGDLIPGDKVNVERSLKIGERLDGHFVLGHVDGKGKIEEKIIKEDNCTLWISLPRSLRYGLISKGSIGVDGVSLTIADIKKDKFAIALIPHTLKITTLGRKKKGDFVNIEIDYLGKWIRKLTEDAK